MRRAGWSALSHGLHVRPETCVSLVDELRAWVLVLPRSGAFTSLTVAALRGWWLPPPPLELPVFVAMSATDNRPRREGLRVSRQPQPFSIIRDHDLPVVTSAEALLAAGRLLSLLDLVILADSALHLGDCTVADLSQIACLRRRGAPALRRALRYVDGRSESSGETMLRLLHVTAGIDVEPQHEILDTDGRVVARGDLWLRGTRRLSEYDGAHHRDPKQYERDRTRDRLVQRLGFEPYSYSSPTVLRNGASVLRDADHALGRDHDPARIRLWHRLLADSAHSAAGRTALVRRLKSG